MKTPYNFVPINEKVYFPEWIDQISHDMPFSDGKSGELTVKIKAESPIFVKNGQQSDSEDISFSKFKNNFFIPGTSIKGMIHSVLEIMSFSKMKQVDDRKFSWRDLDNPAYSSQFTDGFSNPPKVRAGFLKKENDDWYLVPATMARIEQCELHSDFGTRKGLLSSVDKYNFWEKEKKLLTQQFDISDPGINRFIKQCGKFRKATINPDGTEEGTLVFTGQIQPRDKGKEGEHGNKKKHLEFVFFDKQNKNKIKIDQEMRRNFELNHSKERNIAHHKLALAPNEEWAHWKEKLNNGELIPVFWLPRNDKQVSSFGLAMLYRLPFNHSVKDLLPADHKKQDLDLAQAIFGTVEKDHELKGRVQFSMAKAIGEVEELEQRQVVLSNPKATYYPAYIWQPENRGKKEYMTYDNRFAELSGRKRYPVHENNTPVNNFQSGQENLSTTLKPLGVGTQFKFKVRFHNLKPVELGALLSAITLHGHSDQLYHSIGMGKPLGYGKLKVKNIQGNIKYENTDLDTNNINKYLKLFEEQINMALKEEQYWIESEQIKELFAMSKDQKNDDSLQYMKEPKSFANSKKNYEALKRYSTITTAFQTETKADKNDIQNNKKQIMQFESKIKSSTGLEKVVNKIELCQFRKNDISKLAQQGFEQFIITDKAGASEIIKQYWKLADESVSQYITSLSSSDENYANVCNLVVEKSLNKIDDNTFIDKLYVIKKKIGNIENNNLKAIFNRYKKELKTKTGEDNKYAKLLHEIEDSTDNNRDKWLTIYKTHIKDKETDDIKQDSYWIELVKKMHQITKKPWGEKKAKKDKKGYHEIMSGIVKELKKKS